MPIEWAIIFFGTIAASAYFSYQEGMKKGIEEATVLTLANLEGQGLIHFDSNGIIKSGAGKRVIGEMLNERDGE